MSFSFQFAARNRTAALALVTAQFAPYAVKSFLSAAIEKLPEDQPVTVKAHGHLFSGEAGNYDVSTANIEVSPMRFTEPPAPAVTEPPTTEAPLAVEATTEAPTEAPVESTSSAPATEGQDRDPAPGS